MNDADYMEMALKLAERGRGYTSPNPMVGAVIVKNDEVVGKGWHEKVGGPHAEVNAISDAGEKARGGTLYVTLEPCNHQGRTPPCTQAVIEAGIERVVVAMDDPNPGVAGGGNAFLESNGISVTRGVCEAAARRLNESFVKYVLTRHPFVILKCAATLDGRIAAKTGDSKWVTGPAAREYVHELRHASDAIMVGVDTVKADDPQLTTRLKHGQGRNPLRIVLDTGLTIPTGSKVLQADVESGILIVTAKSAPASRRDRLAALGARIVEAPVSTNGRIDLAELMPILGEMGICSLLIEGGSRVAASALSAKIVDKICFFYAPKILGGDGIPICNGPGPSLMKDAIGVSDIDIRRFGEDILVEGYIRQTA